MAETPSLIPRMAGHWKDKPYWLMDIGMAVENFCLQAADEGLGTCIVGWFDEKGVRKVLGIPTSKRIPLVITLGYPAGEIGRTKQAQGCIANVGLQPVHGNRLEGRDALWPVIENQGQPAGVKVRERGSARLTFTSTSNCIFICAVTSAHRNAKSRTPLLVAVMPSPISTRSSSVSMLAFRSSTRR